MRAIDRTIWQIPLDLVEKQQLVQLPPGSRILTVARREGSGDHLDLFAEVTPTEPRQVMFYRVRLVATGGRPPIDTAMRYVSTVQLDGGQRVFHAYATAVQPGEIRQPS